MTKDELIRENQELKAVVKALQETMVQMGEKTSYVPYPVQQPYQWHQPYYPNTHWYSAGNVGAGDHQQSLNHCSVETQAVALSVVAQ